MDRDAGPYEVGPEDEVLPECSQCHGDDQSSAPPKALDGATDTTDPRVGAHRAHLDPAPVRHRKIDCQDCHIVPEETGSPGHIDGDNRAELTFGALAQTGGSNPDFAGQTCNNVYCHGATLAGGTANAPDWTVVNGSQASCGSCHGLPPPAPHPPSAATDCGNCHPTLQPGTFFFLDPDSHVNGVIDTSTDTAQSCTACHGGADGVGDEVSAPPQGLEGETARDSLAVGAHREHLGPSEWHRELFCANCHVVPVNIDDPGHIDDGDETAEVNFDNLNPDADYDGGGGCKNLYCHGDGQNKLGDQNWADDITLVCSSCHGDQSNRPGDLSKPHERHIVDESLPCGECHSSVVTGIDNFVDPNLHLNGVRDVSFADGGTYNANNKRCSNVACHEDFRWRDDD